MPSFSTPERIDPAAAPDGGPPHAAQTLAFLLALRARGISDTAVLRAMENVPRALFAPARCADLAGADVSLPLACGQTMLAPGTVATLLASLRMEAGQRVLEVGTGSGYVTALLARIAGEVVSVERYRSLAIAAAERLASIGEERARVAQRDGLALTREFGSFERIVLTGSVSMLPESLLSLVAPGGRLVAAVTLEGAPRLVAVTRTETGAFREELGDMLRLPPLVPGLGNAL